MEEIRCGWANQSEIEKVYHDEEWGKPLHNDEKLFEMLVLETMQAGLSWRTILNKRESFREAFDQFDAKKISLYDEEKVAELLANPGIIRNKLKVRSTITNAQTFLKIQKQYGSFNQFIWAYVEGEPTDNHFEEMTEVPANTELSKKISKDLVKLGFKFVGPTVVYAFMQSTGMVNDHIESCFVRNK